MRVIMVAYGSGAQTTRAARRLMRSVGGDDFHIVRAGPWVRTPNDAAVAGRVSDEVGTTAVEAIAASTEPGEPVLIVHDDVHVTRRGVTTMEEHLTPDVDAVVPFTNDRGTHQFMGPLPAADGADRNLDAASGLESRRIPEGRYSAMMARAGLLRNLAGSIVIPGSTLLKDSVTIVVAPVASSHDASCADATAPATDRPLLVGSMIVKDEEEMLGGALASMAGVVDRVELYDTGSTDRTIEIARAAGANVSEIEWRNDFGWARNAALETCRDAAYILCLDADERIVVDDPERFRQWLTTWTHEIDGLRVNVANIDDDGDVYLNHMSNRVSRGHSAAWRGALHEQLEAFSDDPGKDPRVLIHRTIEVRHLGYMQAVQEKKGKAERNQAISRAAHEADPSFKTRMDLARSLRMTDQDSEEAADLFRECLDEIEGLADGLVPPNMRSYITAQVAAICVADGELERAEELARAALELTPSEDTALATIGFVLLGAGRSSELTALRKELDARPPGQPIFALDLNHARADLFAARAFLEEADRDSAIEYFTRTLRRNVGGIESDIEAMLQRVLAPGFTTDELGRLFAADPQGHILSLVMKSLPAAGLSAACLAALRAGSLDAEVGPIGFVAGLVGGGTDVDEYVPHLISLPPERVTALAESAARRGRLDLAEALVTSLVAA